MTADNNPDKVVNTILGVGHISSEAMSQMTGLGYGIGELEGRRGHRFVGPVTILVWSTNI